MSRTFLDLSKAECKSSYPILMENSDRHFKIAEKLSLQGEYGPAISHVVLSSEEMIKAWVLFFDSLGLRIRSIKGSKRLFRAHKVRHEFAAFLYLMGHIFRYYIEMLREISRQPEALKHAGNKKSELYIKLKKTAQELIRQGLAGMDWWSKAEELKQRGFYVDYHNGLIAPNALTVDDYNEAAKTFGVFRKMQIDTMGFMQKGNQQELALFTKQFQNENLYGLLEQMIDLSR